MMFNQVSDYLNPESASTNNIKDVKIAVHLYSYFGLI